MIEPRIVHRQDLVVALDYGQFSLQTADTDPDLAVTLLEQAQDADGIAQADGLVVVESPHQNNFEMPLHVEVWDGPPADDLDQWQEAFEAHLEVTDQLVYESPTVDLTSIDVPPGSYHALITGRGFVGHGWPGSTEPGDEWRIRLWPADEALVARRLREFEAARSDENEKGWSRRTPHEDVGRMASRRIRDDLDAAPGARDLSVLGGEVRLRYSYPYTRRRVWTYFAAPHTWLTWHETTQIGSDPLNFDPEVGRYFCIERDEVFPERQLDEWILGSTGDIRGEWIDLRPLATVSYRWIWRKSRDTHDSDGNVVPWEEWKWNRPPAIPVTTVHVDLHVQRVDGKQHTQVELTHSGLPAAWTDDMHDWWAWQLEHCERIISIN